jgi:hypothetical protein
MPFGQGKTILNNNSSICERRRLTLSSFFQTLVPASLWPQHLLFDWYLTNILEKSETLDVSSQVNLSKYDSSGEVYVIKTRSDPLPVRHECEFLTASFDISVEIKGHTEKQNWQQYHLEDWIPLASCRSLKIGWPSPSHRILHLREPATS